MSGTLPTHPDDVRQALREAGERRAAADRQRAGAMLDTQTWLRRGVEVGVPIAELARLAGVTRQTVYDLTRDDEG